MKNFINMKKIFLIMLSVFGFLSCDFLENKTVHVPKTVIQSRIDKKFPISKNFLLAKLTLKNPKVTFKDTKMYIESDYDGSMLSDSIDGKMYMSTNIKYDEIKEELFLVDFSIDRIVDSNGKELMNSKIENTLRAVLSNYLESTPVYKYGEEYEEKNKDKDKKKVKIKNMYIKDNKFFVRT